MTRWDSVVGDCRQEWVFIGQDLDTGALQRELDHCLLSAEVFPGLFQPKQPLGTDATHRQAVTAGTGQHPAAVNRRPSFFTRMQ